MRDGIYKAARLDMAFEPYVWDFADNQRERIKAHWLQKLKISPKIYDGKVLLLKSGDFSAENGGVFRGVFFETDFRNFLALRDFGFPDAHVRNCFAMAALRSADGAYLMGVMGPHTSNAGKIYFAAGTPDANDIVGDRVDLEGSLLREMEEETGFRAQDGVLAKDWRLVASGGRIACLKTFDLRFDAEEALARARKHIESEKDPELSGMCAVRGEADIDPARMPDFVQIFLRSAFALT